MSNLHYDGFNYLEFLKRRKFIDQLYPAITNEGQTINGLLVPVDTALSEILEWSGQEVTRSEFLRYLKQNGITTADGEDFQKLKQSAKEQRLRVTIPANDRLREIADTLEVSYSRIEAGRIVGKSGSIQDDGTVLVDSRSKRHLSGIKRRLGFLEETKDGFALKDSLEPRETEAIRDVLGLKKRPQPKTSLKQGVPIEKVPS